jgi:hypothetical protein
MWERTDNMSSDNYVIGWMLLPPVRSSWQQHVHTSAVDCRSMEYNGQEYMFIVEYGMGTE